jgi:hypothetical protein
MTLPAYTCNPKHRDRSPGESQWTISEHDEISCFTLSHGNGWIDERAGTGFGLHTPDKRPLQLGVVEDHCSPSYVAKFVGDTTLWHGYPADHMRKTQDIPPGRVLIDWRDRGYLTKAKASKLSMGKRCNL